MAARFIRGFCVVSALSSAGLLLACQKAPEPAAGQSSQPAASSPKPAEATPPAAASALPAVQITWVDPSAFRRVPPPNAMRKASYVVPHAAGDTEDGELAVFYFGPSEGGGIEQNVQRWVKQFADVKPDDVKRADREANGLRQHTVEIDRGTFDAGQMAMGPAKGPKKDYALQGAIVEAPSGAYFFKMTGPAKTVAAARPEFVKMLDSVKAGS